MAPFRPRSAVVVAILEAQRTDHRRRAVGDSFLVIGVKDVNPPVRRHKRHGPGSQRSGRRLDIQRSQPRLPLVFADRRNNMLPLRTLAARPGRENTKPVPVSHFDHIRLIAVAFVGNRVPSANIPRIGIPGRTTRFANHAAGCDNAQNDEQSCKRHSGFLRTCLQISRKTGTPLEPTGVNTNLPRTSQRFNHHTADNRNITHFDIVLDGSHGASHAACQRRPQGSSISVMSPFLETGHPLAPPASPDYP